MLLSTQNVSNVSSVDFTSLISSSYKNYKIVFDSALSIGSSTDTYLMIQLSDDNGTTYQTANYRNYLGGGITSGLACGLVYDGNNTIPYVVSGYSALYNLLSGSNFVSNEGEATFFDPVGLSLAGQQHHGVYNGTSLSVNAVRVVSSDGQNISGNFYLYGF
jgi:hypothetical protein